MLTKPVRSEKQLGANANKKYFSEKNFCFPLCLTTESPRHCKYTLTKYGADVNTTDGQGNTAPLAATKTRYEALGLLVDFCDVGADIDKANTKERRNTLFANTKEKHPSHVQPRHNVTSTFVTIAVKNGHVNALEVLCQHGTNINTEHSGITLLTIAAETITLSNLYWERILTETFTRP